MFNLDPQHGKKSNFLFWGCRCRSHLSSSSDFEGQAGPASTTAATAAAGGGEGEGGDGDEFDGMGEGVSFQVQVPIEPDGEDLEPFSLEEQPAEVLGDGGGDDNGDGMGSDGMMLVTATTEAAGDMMEDVEPLEESDLGFGLEGGDDPSLVVEEGDVEDGEQEGGEDGGAGEAGEVVKGLTLDLGISPLASPLIPIASPLPPGGLQEEEEIIGEEEMPRGGSGPVVEQALRDVEGSTTSSSNLLAGTGGEMPHPAETPPRPKRGAEEGLERTVSSSDGLSLSASKRLAMTPVSVEAGPLFEMKIDQKVAYGLSQGQLYQELVTHPAFKTVAWSCRNLVAVVANFNVLRGSTPMFAFLFFSSSSFR